MFRSFRIVVLYRNTILNDLNIKKASSAITQTQNFTKYFPEIDLLPTSL